MITTAVLGRPGNQMPRRFRMSRSILILILALLCVTSQARAQAPPVKSRPKIGLALAGGAALGIAHVGVLDWFNKHHIPIDYLAGTSMGGLIGGCYCTGMPPNEMRTLLKTINWDEALGTGPAYDSMSFRRKEDMRDIPSRFAVGLRKGVSLPAGLSPAGPIGLLLSHVSLPYSEIQSFDELPTPFRCIAVDLNKGEAVTLKDGSLATAMRATMAIPGVFTPVERDGKLLTDGGTLNNIPTEALKQMGADIIIAVDLSASLFDHQPTGSLVEILDRTINVTTYANERRSLKLADIILMPDLSDLSGADFEHVDTFAARGYQAAEDKAKILERFALSDSEWQDYIAKREARRRKEVPPPTFVQVEGVNPKSANTLQSRLKPLLKAPLSLARIDRELTLILGEGRYESFQYKMGQKDNREGLQLYAQAKKYGPPFLRFGLEVNGADTDNIRTNFAARLVAQDVGIPGAETRTSLRLGSDKEISFEYYRPLDKNVRWFIAPYAFYNDDSVGVYSEGSRVAMYGYRTAGVGIDVGYNTSRQSELRLGYQLNHEMASVRTGSPLLPSLAGYGSTIRLQWSFDGQDSPMIPTRGNRLDVKTNWYFAAPGGSQSFPTAETRLSSFHPLTDGSTLFGGLNFGTSFGHEAASLQQFTLGGPLRLGAYGLEEFRGNNYMLMSLGYLHRLFQLPSFIGGKVMVGSWYEVGGTFQSFSHTRYLDDVSVGFMAETLFGPVILGYSYGEHNRNNFYFSIGRVF